MIKLNKIVDELETINEHLNDKIEKLEEKEAQIEDNAGDLGRDLTEAEEARISKITDEIEELEQEMDAILDALDYLNDWIEEE